MTDVPAQSLSALIVRHAANTTFEHLPPAVIRAAKLSILDTLAVAWAGLESSGVAQARAAAIDLGGRPDSLVWGSDQRLPATQAAFANGVAAAALDFDSLHIGGSVHADIVVLPAVLAIAERTGASGKALLTAHALGVDLTARLGMAAPGHSGWFYSSIHGIFGAALGAAHLLGLDQTSTVNALGLALPQAGGTQQPMVEKSQAKRLQSAFAARAGVDAALLAAQGLQGPREVFEGRFGAFSLYEPANPATVLDGLGQRWEGQSTAFKKYPNCGAAHGALSVALELIREHDLRPETVSGVTVILTPYAHRAVGAAYEPGDQPQVAAQFSVQYALATALRYRRFDLQDIEPAAACDPETVALARRVRVEVYPDSHARMLPAQVAFATDKGIFEGTALSIPGSASNPLTEDDVLAKARTCFAYGARPLATAAAERLIQKVLAFEAIDDVSTLWK